MFEFEDNTHYEKQIIGKLIYYYRRNKKIKLDKLLYNKGLYYESFCTTCNKCKNPEIICSAGTLYKIEKGEMIVKNDCFYHRLCENINKKYVFDEKEYLRLHKYQQLLYDNLVCFSKKNLISLALNLEQDSKRFEDAIYICEILSLYLHIIQYVLYKKTPDKNDIHLYMYLKDCVCELDRKLILFFLFHMSNEFIAKELDRKHVLEECSEYFDDELFYEMKLSSIVDNNFLDAFPILEEEEKKEHLSKFQKFNVIKYKAFVLLNAGLFEKCYSALMACLAILEEDLNYSNVELFNCYRRLGIVSYILKKYDESINNYKKVIAANLSLGVNYCLFFYALELLNRNEEVVNVLSTIDFTNDNRNMNEKIILDYYREKYLHGELTKERMRVLEKYICETINPIFQTIGSMQKNVFVAELKSFVKKTGDYKFLYEVIECNNN